jgi:hypothetical protein
MEISRHWRLREQRYALTGTVCTQCGKRFFTPRLICDACNSASTEVYRFDGKRHVHAAQVLEPAQR